MYTCLYGVYVLAIMSKAFMPSAHVQILNYLGLDELQVIPESFEIIDFNLSDPKPLFMRMA